MGHISAWHHARALGPVPAATSSPNNRNVHRLLPDEVEIDAGGAVNFIISGAHLVLIYDDGTGPGDIDTSLIAPGTTPPGFIDDPNNRIYRGLDARTLSYVPAPGTTVNFAGHATASRWFSSPCRDAIS